MATLENLQDSQSGMIGILKLNNMDKLQGVS